MDKAVHAEVMRIKSWLDAHPLPGMVATVPAYQSLAVFTNPEEVLTDDVHWRTTLEHAVQQALESPIPAEVNNECIEIPVCYDDELGPDLPEVARQTGLQQSEIIALHANNVYEVMMMGFVPGFAYMGILPEALYTQRKSTPRISVPPGSVAIAGAQTGIYSFATPGGWNIIGRTPIALIQHSADHPFLLRTGVKVKFKPINRATYDALLATANSLSNH